MELVPLNKLLDLSSKTAIVTGGAMGIGFGVAYRLAEAGANVVIADLDYDKATDAARQLKAKGWQALAVTCHLSKAPEVDKMVAATVKSFGAIAILVNNAGIYPNILVMNM